jgi:ferredoxin
MKHQHESSPILDECIKTCLACMTSCTHHLAHHCLPSGGKHVEPGHVILMQDCAEVCALAASFATRGSAHHEAARASG